MIAAYKAASLQLGLPPGTAATQNSLAIPFSADLSKQTNYPALAAALYKAGFEPIPILPGTKACKIHGWSKMPLPVRPWPSGYGIGLRCGKVVPIDIDVYDAGIVESLLSSLRADFDIITRVGQPPKVLVPVSCAEVQAKLMSDTYIDQSGNVNKIEVLSHGQQFVGYAIHPDTHQPYTWSGDLLTHHLPEVSLDHINGLFDAFYDLACSAGWKRLEKKAKKKSSTHPTDRVKNTDSSPYGEAALQEEAEKVRTAPQGNRNHTLNEAAFSLGTLVAGGELPEEVVITELTAAAEAARLPWREIKRTLRSGLDSGKQHPRQAAADATEDFAAFVETAGKAPAAAEEEEWEPAIQEWPILIPLALRGIAGDFVALAAEKSEADPAAILITFLVRFGVEVGSSPTLFIGDTRHKPRLAAVIVGASSKARKGTSAKPIERLFGPIEGKARYSPGPFSSGEGIIYAVRDSVAKWDEKNQCEVVTDPGVTDKRLFILDEEFAGAMAQTKREGNTLSMVIRAAWDNGTLDPLTKTSKTTATNAHVGWLSHITLTELQARLSESEVFNGFANRILWVCARRSKIVPLPEPMDDNKLDGIRRRLVETIGYYRRQDFVKIEMGPDARQAWVDSYYADLTKDNPGLVGCVINRAEAQVARLAMLFCLLDAKTIITLAHLDAAIALWRYCEASARYIFHGRQTDGVAEKILEALAIKPLTGTELFSLFSNNVSKTRLQTALSGLKASGQIVDEKVPSSGRKPVTTWKLGN